MSQSIYVYMGGDGEGVYISHVSWVPTWHRITSRVVCKHTRSFSFHSKRDRETWIFDTRASTNIDPSFYLLLLASFLHAHFNTQFKIQFKYIFIFFFFTEYQCFTRHVFLYHVCDKKNAKIFRAYFRCIRIHKVRACIIWVLMVRIPLIALCFREFQNIKIQDLIF